MILRKNYQGTVRSLVFVICTLGLILLVQPSLSTVYNQINIDFKQVDQPELNQDVIKRNGNLPLTELGRKMRSQKPPINRICLEDANCWWLLGVNLPWNLYGHDFGQAAWETGSWSYDGVNHLSSKLQVEKDFAYLKSKGVHVIRWYLFTDGRAAPEFDNQGYITGFDHYFYDDVDAALALARQHNLYLILVLMDFHWLDHPELVNGVQLGGHADIITDLDKRQSFFDNALGPFLARYGDERHIIALEVISEPEWAMSGIPGGGTIGPAVSNTEMQSFVRATVSYIQSNSSRLVTIGSAQGQWLAYWQDIPFDFIQVHYYDWMGNQPPFSALNLEGPIVLGEFPTKSTAITMTRYLSTTWENNYAGAIAWSLKADDSFSNFSSPGPTDDFQQWSEAHDTNVNIRFKVYLPIILKSPPFELR